jgi:hypothetical protein
MPVSDYVSTTACVRANRPADLQLLPLGAVRGHLDDLPSPSGPTCRVHRRIRPSTRTSLSQAEHGRIRFVQRDAQTICTAAVIGM